MNPDVLATQTALQPVLTDYGDSILVVLPWTVPFVIGLALTAYAAYFFLRLLSKGATGHV